MTRSLQDMREHAKAVQSLTFYRNQLADDVLALVEIVEQQEASIREWEARLRRALEGALEADRIDSKMGFAVPGDSAIGIWLSLHAAPELALLSKGVMEG